VLASASRPGIGSLEKRLWLQISTEAVLFTKSIFHERSAARLGCRQAGRVGLAKELGWYLREREVDEALDVLTRLDLVQIHA
jgi:hypothetical protein